MLQCAFVLLRITAQVGKEEAEEEGKMKRHVGEGTGRRLKN